MSAQPTPAPEPTEAHRRLSGRIRSLFVAAHISIEDVAQLIADSERAVTEAIRKERDEAQERLQPLMELVERHTIESEESFETEDVLEAHYKERDEARSEVERLKRRARWIGTLRLEEEVVKVRVLREAVGDFIANIDNHHVAGRGEFAASTDASLRALRAALAATASEQPKTEDTR